MEQTNIIPERAQSGQAWEIFTFADLARRKPCSGPSHRLDTMGLLSRLVKALQTEIGWLRGLWVLSKSFLWDTLIKNPKFQPPKFQIETQKQLDFYKKEFSKNLPIIALYENLSREIGKSSADIFIADQLLPVVLTKIYFSPVADLDSVEVWLNQAREYLGKEIEEDQGFEGQVYLAEDKSELRFYVTRCAAIQLIREYGMVFTREHTLSTGCNYCDHCFRVREETDPILKISDYADLKRIDSLEEFIAHWAERAKSIFFGSQEEWQEYANEYFGK